jgi:hypothetical protein
MSGDVSGDGDQVNQDVLRLAVRRFLADHPDHLDRARDWLAALDIPEHQALVRPDPGELEAAELRLDQLRAVGGQVLQAGLAAEAARSGTFDAAGGPLADFLVDVGWPVARLDIE